MTTQELAAKTVIELRKIAKENGVTLGAGVSKSDIVAKIAAALGDAQPAPEPAQEPAPAPVPAEESQPAEEAKAAETAAAQPQFKAAWHNPSPRYNSKPAYQAPSYPQRNNGWQNNSARPGVEPQRPAPVRPNNYTPRFGPAADTPSRQEDEYRPYRSEQPARSGFGPAAAERRNDFGPAAERRPAYGENQRNDFGPAAERRPAYSEAPRNEFAPQRNNFDNQGSFNSNYDNGYNRNYAPRNNYSQQRREPSYFNQEPSATNAAVNELLSAGEYGEGSGVLELHPDGYGFLRSEQFLPSSKDIYVSMAQIRRFGLRTGDRVLGKTRPQRDGDKYTAMLYITEVNGAPADELAFRPAFDELTPVYPSRRIQLESHTDTPLDSMRLTDLVAPLGFGQRGLILCPPDTGKTELLQDFANVISANHPDATVMVLLIDVNPEDVTCFREQVTCPVLASTFDQPPENHLRLTEMVLERAMRLVEQGKDVVLIVDSLTRLAKIYTTSAAQQGRSMSGMVNPTSLFRAKKLFGAARCLKEGGSLTVIGAMNVETGSKVDDSIVEEFKGTANMELVLDASLVAAGVAPAIDLQRSGTKRADMLLTQEQLEGLQLVRNMLATTRSAAAIPQILSLMNKTDSNNAFLARFKDWVALMEKMR